MIATENIIQYNIQIYNNAIVSVRLSVCWFPLYLLNRLTSDLDLMHVWLAVIETEGHRARLALGLGLGPRRGRSDLDRRSTAVL